MPSKCPNKTFSAATDGFVICLAVGPSTQELLFEVLKISIVGHWDLEYKSYV